MEENMIVERARMFALAAHSSINQRRKYTGEPYIVHPYNVAQIIKSITTRPDMIAAAYLHDVVEDTEITNDIILREFGYDIAQMVYFLTDISRPHHGSREIRKRLDRNHIASAGYAPQTIKVADLIDNTSSIEEHDPNFAKVYMSEKILLLDVLKLANTDLRTIAIKQVVSYKAKNPPKVTKNDKK